MGFSHILILKDKKMNEDPIRIPTLKSILKKTNEYKFMHIVNDDFLDSFLIKTDLNNELANKLKLIGGDYDPFINYWRFENLNSFDEIFDILDDYFNQPLENPYKFKCNLLEKELKEKEKEIKELQKKLDNYKHVSYKNLYADAIDKLNNKKHD